MTPILFLDFDGVIRVAIEGGWVASSAAEFCPGRMRMLRQACDAVGARIVVSSDWRNMENREEIAGHLSPWLADLLHEDWGTPIIGHRHNEVQRWLNVHPEVTRYAILEDFEPHFQGCSAEMRERLVMCNNRFGLVPELVPRVIAALGK
jgi:hypothetical protein